MTDKAATRQRVLGIDVSCHRVTLYDEATGRTHDIANDAESLHEALAGFTGHTLAVCEATGGHEDALLAALHVLGIPAHRADAAKVKAYIRSFGKRAKPVLSLSKGLTRSTRAGSRATRSTAAPRCRAGSRPLRPRPSSPRSSRAA